MENEALLEKFEQLAREQQPQELRSFLDDQLITDIAELIYEDPEQAPLIINNLTLSRAAAAFRILEFPTQEEIIQHLPAHKTAELLNELPR